MPGRPRLKVSPQPNQLLGDYLTPEQLAAELGIRPSTLVAWQRLGKAPPQTKIGRAPYYSKSTVIAWLQLQERVA